MAKTTEKPSAASLLKAADEILAAAKPARKTAVKKTVVKAGATAAASSGSVATKAVAKRATAKGAVRTATAAERKKAEEKLADLIVTPTARRPGRPAKSNPDADYDDGDSDADVEVIPDIKIPKGRGKRGKDAKDLISRGPVTPEEYEARRNRLKLLIKLGKDRGYLTYGEINDHLPDDLVDAEAIDGIISTFSDMGISVYDQAPDAETLLMSENAPVASSDDDAEEEADATLSTVDSDFGRTTDPVRMYMREMGSVELLTREGEIEIAKRIE